MGPHVVDDAAVLDGADKVDIEKRLSSIEARTHRRAIVVTLPSLQGHKIEEVTEVVGNRLGMTDGVLLLLAPHEREVHIAIGRGAAKLVTNGEARKIINETMYPDLHANRFGPAVRKGAARIAAELSETMI